MANQQSDNVTILYATTDGRFRPEYRAVGAYPESIEALDPDEEGWVHLTTVNRLSQDASYLENSQYGFSAARSLSLDQDTTDSADESLTNSTTDEKELHNSVAFFPRRFVTGDFNEDAQADFIVINDVANEFELFLGDGQQAFRPAIRFPTLEDPEFVTAHDFNQDGHLDLLLCHDHEDSITVWLGTGTGNFHSVWVQEVGKQPEHAAVADFDGDGQLDVAIHVDGNTGDESVIKLFLGNGDGTFQITPAAKQAVPAQAQGMVVVDLDMDAEDDLPGLALVSDKAASVTVLSTTSPGLLNHTQGFPNSFFAASSPFDKPRSIDTADLNQDGYTDLVLTELSNDRIWVIWGQKGQSSRSGFQAPELLYEGGDESISPIGDYADTPVLIRDLNNDGFLDIVKVNEIPNEVVILWSMAAKSLPHEIGTREVVLKWVDQIVPIIDAENPGAIAADDFNGDGRLDLVIGNRGSHDVSLLWNEGFTPSGQQAFSQQQLAALQWRVDDLSKEINIDWNGDGLTDKVEVDIDRSHVQVLLELPDRISEKAEQIALDVRVPPQLLSPDNDPDGMGDRDAVDHADILLVDALGKLTYRGWDAEAGEYGPANSFRTRPEDDSLENIRDLVIVHGYHEHTNPIVAVIHQPIEELPKEAGVVSLYEWIPGQLTLVDTLRVGTLPSRITAGDLNGDGIDDLIVLDAAENRLYILDSSQPDEFRVSPIRGALKDSVPDDVIVMDVTGRNGTRDEKPDLLVTNRGAGNVTVLQNTGDLSQFETALRLTTSTRLYGVSVNFEDGQETPLLHSPATT